jgi:nitroimidazol reductase NimA-like FMN-containing flavoprotein (pyridoxamine 5'-phosphate oxidase superfamily)
MNTIEARTTLDVLDRDECLRLLARHHLGRLAVVVDDQPLVFPVNYALASHSIVFRTDPGTKLHAAHGHRVAFEIDGTDAQYHEGWSVLVVGTAREELEPTRLRDMARLPLGPWCPGATAHWMRIGTSAITGRRITHSAPT